MRRPDNTVELWQEPAVRVFRALRLRAIECAASSTRLRYVRSATEALPDGAVLIKRNGEIDMFNMAAQTLLGLSSRDVGQNFVSLVRNPEIAALVNGQAAEGLVEITATHSDLQLEVRRIDIDETRLLVLARDVSQLNRLLSMRQDFVANVSHELRTPLTVILGYLESLDDESLDQEQLRGLIARLRSPAKRMKVLVDDLLLLTRLESSPKPSQTDVDMVAVAPMLESIVAEARQISTDSIGSPSKRIRRCVCAAASSNCTARSRTWSATPFATARTAATSTFAGSKPTRVRASRFEDHGMGIPAHHLTRITERFYRVDLSGSRARGGTGLGLAIVKHVLKRHDATLGVQSELNKGSLFFCVFPQSAVTAS